LITWPHVEARPKARLRSYVLRWDHTARRLLPAEYSLQAVSGTSSAMILSGVTACRERGYDGAFAGSPNPLQDHRP